MQKLKMEMKGKRNGSSVTRKGRRKEEASCPPQILRDWNQLTLTPYKLEHPQPARLGFYFNDHSAPSIFAISSTCPKAELKSTCNFPINYCVDQIRHELITVNVLKHCIRGS